MYADRLETILDRREMLKVKVKSLAAEARIIRREEQRTHGPLRAELHWHRIFVVRRASREAGLAYGYVRGKTLEQMEPNAGKPGWVKPDEDAIGKMVKKYGPVVVLKKAA